MEEETKHNIKTICKKHRKEDCKECPTQEEVIKEDLKEELYN